MRTFRLLLVLLLVSVQLFSQQNPGTGPKEKSLKKEMRANKLARKEARERRRAERAERKAVKKHHKRIQTKKVRKRMKQSKGTAYRNNENKREFFVKRWFKKKNKKSGKVRKKD